MSDTANPPLTKRGRPRVLSGIQPTADSFHFGNYLGALAQWVAMQDDHDAFYAVVDLHAITMGHDPAALRRRTRVAAAQLLAIGLDPERCTLFVQSHVRQHAEIAWVLSCITGYGEASRMTQFKDKSAKAGSANTTVGLFNYPILMAGDILIYQADQVPVGEDQRQHLELSRTLAQRFNQRFGPTFTVPEPYIVKETAKIYDLQEPTAKMSKSSSSPQGVIDLLEDPASIRKKIMRAVTDTGSEVRAAPDKPGITNLLSIMAAVTGDSVADLEKRYGDGGYGTFKKAVADAVVEFVGPIQERFARWYDDEKSLAEILERGALRASAVAEETMVTVRDRIGFLPAAMPR